MASPIRVFLSHTSDMAEFPRSRSFVRSALDAVSRAGMATVDMRYFPAGDSDAADYCRQRVRECQVLVGVIGFRYGSIVPNELVSFTEMDINEAGTAGITRLIFLLDEEANIPASLIDARREKIDTFRERLRSSRLIVRTFKSAAGLELEVFQALKEALSAPAGVGQDQPGVGHTMPSRHGEPSGGEAQSAPGAKVVVDQEVARLTFDDQRQVFHAHIRRRLENIGTEPVTRYLIRIAVDRYPGDPVRSNQHHRSNPLTWKEIGLSARSEGEQMLWLVKDDRDAAKEVWLLFENSGANFPLYPGEVRWIDYEYTVPEDKWGPWWNRAIRLPTRHLTMLLDFPASLRPQLWGIETSMTANSRPFRTRIQEHEQHGRVFYRWSTENPEVLSRFRIEWKFRADMAKSELHRRLSERMRWLGIVQEADSEPVLRTEARPFDLPREAEVARRVASELVAKLERVSQEHTFAKGMGLAAPQITPDRGMITLLNPQIIGYSSATDEQFEGCLSFFDERGLVPRARTIEVQHQTVDGHTSITSFSEGVARIVAHEIDHLDGLLYRSRMRDGVKTISVEEYGEVGRPWRYDRRSRAD